MLSKRLIPCLDLKDGRVVKGVKFVHLVDAGDPVETAKLYNAFGADELVFLDITASYRGNTPMWEIISRASEQVFLPLTVGAASARRKISEECSRAGRIRSRSIPPPSKIPRSSRKQL